LAAKEHKDPKKKQHKFFSLRFETFGGKSIEVTLHEPFTQRAEFSRSSPIKAIKVNQAIFLSHNPHIPWRQRNGLPSRGFGREGLAKARSC